MGFLGNYCLDCGRAVLNSKVPIWLIGEEAGMSRFSHFVFYAWSLRTSLESETSYIRVFRTYLEDYFLDSGHPDLNREPVLLRCWNESAVAIVFSFVASYVELYSEFLKYFAWMFFLKGCVRKLLLILGPSSSFSKMHKLRTSWGGWDVWLVLFAGISPLVVRKSIVYHLTLLSKWFFS